MQIDLGKLSQNAERLVARLSARGISITAVTKATLGLPEIANVWTRAGVCGLGDSRVENLKRLRQARIVAPMWLIRSPMLSQVDDVLAVVDISLNSELVVIRQLSSAAQRLGCRHRVILMVELGDLREGIMPQRLEATVAAVLGLPNIALEGIGANLACRSGIEPDATKMAELSDLVDLLEHAFGIKLRTITGGNSANLDWALSGAELGRINHLRIGEALLLGCEPLYRQAIEGLHLDAITLCAEVIESKEKPSKSWGNVAESAFGEVAPQVDIGTITQSIFAIGRQDIDPDGLTPPAGMKLLGASSDHLVVDSTQCPIPLCVGDEASFQLNYSALLRAMTSPYVAKVIVDSSI